MAFFDKLSEVAKNIGEKTSDAIETSKLNSKISTETAAADAELRKIGAFYYDQFAQSHEVLPEILELCNTAKAHYNAAADAQAEIEKIKSEGSAYHSTVSVSSEFEAKTKCPSCGTENDSGTKFCGSCGAKLPAITLQSRACINCGSQVANNIKFCPDCGQKMED